jgi:cell division septation protein DedD
VRERAAAAGVKSYTEQVKGQQGEQTRVRAGPFPNRGAAEKARDKLRSLGMDVGQVAQR